MRCHDDPDHEEHRTFYSCLSSDPVRCSCVQDALLRYTTDGSSPLSSPTAVAVPPAGDGATVVWDKLGWTVFKASASKAGYNDSDVAEASYLVLGRAGVPVFGGTTHDNVYIGFANLTITSDTPVRREALFVHLLSLAFPINQSHYGDHHATYAGPLLLCLHHVYHVIYPRPLPHDTGCGD